MKTMKLTLSLVAALLTPDDTDMALKLFNERYEGKESTEELMNLERQRIEKRRETRVKAGQKRLS